MEGAVAPGRGAQFAPLIEVPQCRNHIRQVAAVGSESRRRLENNQIQNKASKDSYVLETPSGFGAGQECVPSKTRAFGVGCARDGR